MGRSTTITHAVNGYSRYDVPESKAFSCTPGILYPVRIDFINARDRVSISQGIDVRSNPLAVPTFNPYTVRLALRFWLPMLENTTVFVLPCWESHCLHSAT